MFKSWLFKPYPLILDVKINLAISFGLAVICFLFLSIFRPFGLHAVQHLEFFIGYGLTILASCIIHFFIIPFLLRNLFIEDQWQIYNQLLFITSITLLTAVFNYLYNSTVGRDFSPQYNLIEFVGMTTAVGILPIIVMTYVTETIANNRNQLLAKDIVLSPKLPDNNTLYIEGDNQKDDKLSIGLDQFVYAKASQNYLTVYYLYEGKLKNKLLRLSLKKLMETVIFRDSIIRCHKSYAINTHHMKNIKGNARSLEIELNHTDTLIPVSRSFDTSLFNR